MQRIPFCVRMEKPLHTIILFEYFYYSLCAHTQVVDRVCTADGVLHREPLRLGAGAQIKEVPVWGIDCYTRRYDNDSTCVLFKIEG